MKPILTALLSCLLASGLASASDDKPAKLTAEEIISKHLEAAGGRDRLTKFRTRIAIGSIKKENDPEGKMAIMSEAPNRLAAVYVLPAYDLRFIYDGGKAMLRPQLPRTLVAFDNKYRDIVASGLMYNGIPLYNLVLQPPADAKFEAKGMKKVRGRGAYVVGVKRPKGDEMRLYFDAETFMWVRTDYGQAHRQKEMRPFSNEPVSRADDDLTVDFYIETSDFKVVDGVKLPFKFQQLVTTPLLRDSSSGLITGTITEYRHNEQIDPSMFR